MEIHLLGPPRVRDGAGYRTVAGRQGALLAALALAARQAVSPGRLVEVVWGTDPPQDGAGNPLQQRISRLRAVLDPDRRGDVLVAAPGGYVLSVDDVHVDARQFEQLVAAGQRDLSNGDLAAAEATLARGLRLWHGAALEGFADELWAVGESRRLEELRMAAVEDRVDALLGLGQHDTAIGQIVDVAPRSPLRERLRGQQMLALYGAGRQAEALALYDDTRRLLADELGVDPGPQLQHVYHRILSHDAELAAQTPAVTLPNPAVTAQTPAVTPPPGNLPASRGTVFGRDQDVERVTHLLLQSRLLTITGPGGAGKTTLAVDAARRVARRDGTWLVELASLSTGSAATGAVAEVLGVARGGLGAERIDAAALTRALVPRHLLLVLDNCEHLLDAVSPLVDQLLAGVPDLVVLATSREPLGLKGEVVWSVPGLGVPAEDDRTVDQVVAAPAVALLVERARAHTPAFALTDATACAAATLTRRLDGIPLAIELAAARLRVLSLGEVTDGLDDRFRLLVGRGRTVASRQRTLRAALDWSWDLLDEPLQRSWAALAVPVDRFESAMVSGLLAAVGVDADAVDVVADLVDRSVLTAETAERSTRYRMLESIRDYGRDRLTTAGLAEDVHAAHADVVQSALLRCQRPLSAERFTVDVRAMSTWLDDARAAMQWAHEHGDRARLQRIAGLLGWLWLLHGLTAEGLAWLDSGLGAPEAADPEVDDGTALFWASALRASSLAADGRAWGDLAVRAASTPSERVLADVCAAGHRANAGDVQAAAERLAAGAEDAGAVGGWPCGFHRLIAAQVAWAAGDQDAARCSGEEAVALLSASGADWAHVHALETLIEDAVLRGELVRARDMALDGVRICRRQRYPELECAMLVHAGWAAHELGHPQDGAGYVGEAVGRARAVGSRSALADARLAAGVLARHRGEVPVARAHVDAAVGLLTEIQRPVRLAVAHADRANLATSGGDAQTAVTQARLAAGLARKAGDWRTVLLATEALAGAVGLADPEAGVALLAAAAEVREAAHLPRLPAEQRDARRVTELLSARLGPDGFERAWSAAAAGRADAPQAGLLGLLDIYVDAPS